MLWFGPVSSVFDIATYLVMFFAVCPQATGGAYGVLDPGRQLAFAALFQAGWFVEPQLTRSLVVHSLRTRKMPFIQSHASLPVFLLTGAGILVSTCLALFLGFGNGPQPLPLSYFAFLLAAVTAYSLLVGVVKKLFVRKYGELI